MIYSELVVVSQPRAIQLTEKEPQKWNVVSLWANEGGAMWDKLTQTFTKEQDSKPKFPKAKSLCQQEFHDIDVETKGAILCSKEQIKKILSFSEKIYGEPLLVHCRAGISRSTAIAFLIYLNALKDKSDWPAEDALSMVYNVRQVMYPNKHIMQTGIPLIARNRLEETKFFRELYNSNVLKRIVGG